jgi:hypothetical protein
MSYGSYAKFYVARNGIVYAQISNVFDTDSQNNNIQVVKPEKALDAVKEHYKNIIVNDPITITEIKLAYVPVPKELVTKDTLVERKDTEYNLTPSWIIKLEQTFDDGEKGSLTQTGYILINALTGEEYR